MTSNTRVLKYGGSSLATTGHIQRVAEQIAGYRQAGQEVVVVASAMGGATSKLLSLAGEVSDDPSLRELDKLLGTGESVSTSLLAMALRRLGVDAISLDGAQSGVVTDSRHFNATVRHVDTRRIRDELGHGRVVIAAGFQGRSPAGEVTTLGRGGSDTSAVVLAGALGADRCEICSDVDGVYSADPRVVSDARRIETIGYDEMIEMAHHGASVLNPDAVRSARDHGVEIYSRSTFEPEKPGTLINGLRSDEPRVVGVAAHDALLRLTVAGGSGRSAHELFDELGADDILSDHVDEEGRRHIAVPAERLPDPEAFAAAATERLSEDVLVDAACSSVSAIGFGVGTEEHFRHTSRRYAREAGVGLRHDFAGEHSITCVVAPDDADRVMNLFHRGFDCPVEEAA